MSLVIRRTSRGNIKTIQGQIELNIFRFIKLKDLFLGGGDLCLTSSNSYHIVSHFGWQLLPKVTKMATVALSLMMDLKQPPKITRFGFIFNLNMLLAMLSVILHAMHLLNSKKWPPWFYQTRQTLATKSKHH